MITSLWTRGDRVETSTGHLAATDAIEQEVGSRVEKIERRLAGEEVNHIQ